MEKDSEGGGGVGGVGLIIRLDTRVELGWNRRL